MATTCTRWKKVQRRSGRRAHERQCGNARADVVQGDNYYTYNVYRNGKWVTRGSRRTLKMAKTAATRLMRSGRRK